MSMSPRSQMIRLAGTMPEGSRERRALLEVIARADFSQGLSSAKYVVEQEYLQAVSEALVQMLRRELGGRFTAKGPGYVIDRPGGTMISFEAYNTGGSDALKGVISGPGIDTIRFDRIRADNPENTAASILVDTGADDVLG